MVMAKLRLTYPVFQQPGQVTFGTGAISTIVQSGLDNSALFLSSQLAVRQVLHPPVTI